VKRYRVRVIEDAEQDLIDIYTYVAASDSGEKAEYVRYGLSLARRLGGRMRGRRRAKCGCLRDTAAA